MLQRYPWRLETKITVDVHKDEHVHKDEQQNSESAKSIQ